MAEVRRTQNPLEYTTLDGVISTERSPVPSVIRAGANSVVFIGQFEKGEENSPKLVGELSEIHSLYGDNEIYSGLKALRLKQWSRLYVVRAVASDSAKATVTQTVSTKDLATFTALWKGKYGNSISVVVSDGTTANTKKLTITLGNQREIFDDLTLNGKTDAELKEIFKESELIEVTSAHATDNIENASLTLTGGSDGTISSSDYQTAIDNSNVNVSGKIYLTDDQSNAVKGVVANYVKTNKNGLCVLGPSSLTTTVADAITESKTLLDSEGRVIYAYNPIRYNIQGVIEEESPAYLMASILSNIPPNLSPAASTVSPYTDTATGVKYNLTDTQMIQLKDAGICGFEDDEDLGVRVRSAVTGSVNWSIIRRRMNDFLLSSLGRYLKNYQNQPNSFLNRSAIKASIIAFDEGLVADGVLPSQRDAGVPVLLVQTEGTTTPTEQAMGIQKIIYKRRIFAEMRFIVLETSVGESVTVESLST